MAEDMSPPNPDPVPDEHPGAHEAPAVGHEPIAAVEVASVDVPTVVESPGPVPAAGPELAPDAETPLAAAELKGPPARKPEPPPEEKRTPEPPAEPEKPAENKKHWYVVKVQSGREDTIKEAIEKRMRKEGLEEFFGQIVIPVEKITEIKQDKNGRRVTRTKERKLYPGYLMVEVEYNDRILYLFRETSGVGDFVGAHPGNLERAPTPMSAKEVQRMLGPTGAEVAASAVPTPPKGLDVGHRVRVVDGTFNGMEGVVKTILDAVGKVQVEVSIFGRPVAVDLEYYQVEEA